MLNVHNIPVGDNWSDELGGIEPPVNGGLGGSILHGALGSDANSLPRFDPINMTQCDSIKCHSSLMKT